MMTLDPEVLLIELEGIAAAFATDEKKALMAGGEVAGRIENLPTVGELVDRIMGEAEEVIRSLPQRFIKGQSYIKISKRWRRE
ncbi:MAG: hypothetical protein KAH98_03795 [Dehalococcoidia bacterium]|nr:hypothetical protein [Dehalococcoidia bacterium]